MLGLVPAMIRRRLFGFELAIVVVVSLAVLVPGIWSYSLVDPWETHYGEVAREMLQNHDLVHMEWNGGMTSTDNEGFRSKPVLMFWTTAAMMRAVGLAENGGYSGEMVKDARTMVAIRLPFILFAVMGLTLMWLMLAKLVDRKLAWLALLVVGSSPFFCLVARQGIPDMPLVACVMGAIAMFTLAIEDGERPIATAFSIPWPWSASRRLVIDHRHILLALTGAFVASQAIYYALYFIHSPQLAVRAFPSPPAFFLVFMGLLFAGLWRNGWILLRFLSVIIGSLVALGVTGWAFRKDRSVSGWAALDAWDRYAPDRFVIRCITFPIAWAGGGGWRETDNIADHLLEMAPLTSMRQVYLLWCYAFIGLSILAKGPPGLGVVGLVGVFHVILFGRWRDLYNGKFELKRGLILMTVVFLPWHIAMWLKDGLRFISEYLGTHILDRAGVGVDNSTGTFEYYTSQIGHGMWLWAALIPVAFAAAVLRSRTDTREGRVRFMMALWAITGVAFFSLVQTKFHHYILPVVPAFGILVAFYLHDLLAKRERMHFLVAGVAIGIVLLICRDLVWEPERWIEMFVFRYDRPWPSGEPWSIDPSDGFLVLAAIACVAIVLLATPWRRLGVGAVCIAGLAICVWSLQIYMPEAGKHWGMREAMRSYYTHRTIYGEKRVYFGPGEVVDDLDTAGDRWHFDTLIPDGLQIGQPMTITLQLNKATDERVMEQQIVLVGHADALADHTVTVKLEPGELAKLQPLLADARRRVKTPGAGKDPTRGRPPVRYVDADRLVAWQLYWRGENFWSGDEIFSWAQELRTGFGKTDNVEFLKYLNDRTKAPLGRRYFIVTEAGRATSVKSMLPTQRARDSFEVLDTTSNKFSMVVFTL
jgi:4-amino-4-deoxy-L-arabinose transferase-like glycosyltransferase